MRQEVLDICATFGEINSRPLVFEPRNTAMISVTSWPGLPYESGVSSLKRKSEPPMAANWFVYIVRCRDQSLYTGITTDPEQRLSAHNSGTSGAKYTRSRRPVTLVYLEETDSRSTASKREYIIKKMSAAKKNELISDQEEIK